MLMTILLLTFIRSYWPHITNTEQAILKELPTIKAEARNMNKIFSTQHLLSHQGRHGFPLTKRTWLQTMLLLVLVDSFLYDLVPSKKGTDLVGARGRLPKCYSYLT